MSGNPSARWVCCRAEAASSAATGFESGIFSQVCTRRCCARSGGGFCNGLAKLGFIPSPPCFPAGTSRVAVPLNGFILSQALHIHCRIFLIDSHFLSPCIATFSSALGGERIWAVGLYPACGVGVRRSIPRPAECGASFEGNPFSRLMRLRISCPQGAESVAQAASRGEPVTSRRTSSLLPVPSRQPAGRAVLAGRAGALPFLRRLPQGDGQSGH